MILVLVLISVVVIIIPLGQDHTAAQAADQYQGQRQTQNCRNCLFHSLTSSLVPNRLVLDEVQHVGSGVYNANRVPAFDHYMLWVY